MKYHSYNIVLQEVPNEISLCLSITGCKLNCDGCHSPYLWKEHGEVLTIKVFKNLLNKYTGLISCVLFMGGEWHENELVNFLIISNTMGLKTCLYTGLDRVNDVLLNNLDYIKYGRWDKNLGGLESNDTNQIFLDLKNKKKLNNLFIR